VDAVVQIPSVANFQWEWQRQGAGRALAWATRRLWLRSRWRESRVIRQTFSAVPLEVVIPCGPRDMVMLPVCVEAIRRFVQHPITRIVVVTPDASRAAAHLPAAADVTIVPESLWLRDIPVPGEVRGGVIQQIIKLESRRHVKADHYLVVDADTVFLRPRVFVTEKSAYVLRYTDTYQRAYHRTLDAFLPGVRRFPVSFVAHHMLFNRAMLDRFIAVWERNCGESWIDYAATCDRAQVCSLSEYELYANHVIADRRARVRLEYWHGVDVSDVALPGCVDEAIHQFPHAASASYHWFRRPEHLATKRRHTGNANVA
jgi:hypothetical protein